MDSGIGLILFLAVAAWVIYQIIQGFNSENAPPIPMVDTGGGIREPVCPKCSVRLIVISRDTRSTAVGVFGMLVGLLGLVLILFNWLVGGIILILAILISMAGKKKQTVLTCPSCGNDARVMG